MRHLVFELHGVMAGFGDHSVGGQRRAATQVPRSAVLGLVQACMGVDRRDVSDSHPTVTGLHLAMAQAAGPTITDYHTTFTPKKEKTVLSRREYQTDLSAAVALWGESALLDEVREALLAPAWTPYLGRRSCPLTQPMRPALVEADTLAEAFAGRAPTAALVHGDPHPEPGFPQPLPTMASDRPAATVGDRRVFAPTLRYTYGRLP